MPEEPLALSRRAMPTLNALAKHGTVFTQAFSSSNFGTPARAGIYNNIDFDRTGLPLGFMLVESLQKAGYATAMIGKYHVGTRNHALRAAVLNKHGLKQGELVKLPPPQRAAIDREIAETGFDYYFGHNHHHCPFYNSEQIWENRTYTGKQPKYNTDLFTEKAITSVHKAIAAKKPFCVEPDRQVVHGPLRPQAPDRYFHSFSIDSFDLQNHFGHSIAVDTAIASFRDAVAPEE